MSAQPNKPRKVVVLGGGLSAMTSVFYLTQEPDWQQKYDITVYQMGWRIGGKGASGVNPQIGYRIEEHGLHLWMGFYENAFNTMRTCYDLLGRPSGKPLASFDEAFKPQSDMTFSEYVDGTWTDWTLKFPTLPGKRGDGILPGTHAFLEMWKNYLIAEWREWWQHHRPKPKPAGLIQRIIRFFKKIFRFLAPVPVIKAYFEEAEHEFKAIEQGLTDRLEGFGEHLIALFFGTFAQWVHQSDNHNERIFKIIAGIRRWLWDELGELVYHNNAARHIWTSMDFAFAVMTGLVRDHVLQRNPDGSLHLDFDVINGYDYGEWLVRNGADPKLTLQSPPVRSMYDGPFAFLHGRVKQPNVEAGTILRIFFRLAFTCKEAVVWRMQAGMGDTIFGPMYEVLSKAGVKFKFFHRAKHLSLSQDQKTVSKVLIGKQVDTVSDSYEPLVTVNELPCWPSEPLYEQIVPAQRELLWRMAAEGKNVNLESSWSCWEDREDIVLEAGKDYDSLIIGFSIATVADLCKELIAVSPRWQQSIQAVKTVQTQAYQLWFNASPAQLGIAPDKLLSTYVEPVDTFATMNQLLDREVWTPDQKPACIAYLCGVMADAAVIPPYSAHNFPIAQTEEAKQALVKYIETNLQHLVPGAYDAQGRFRWEMLTDIFDGTGEARLRSQYWRANVEPSERYVLSVKDSSQYRLETNKTGFDNLFVTGDWIKNGFNAGFVEGAVVSGMLTARAVSGQPIHIIGENWGA